MGLNMLDMLLGAFVQVVASRRGLFCRDSSLSLPLPHRASCFIIVARHP
jgi:hypothetical protein